jgi:DNA-binding PadR family transcriptional regulator
VTRYIHSNFHVLSSGTIYSYLYSLEREGLTVGGYQNKKHVYKIAEQGINLIITLAQNNLELSDSLQSVLDE